MLAKPFVSNITIDLSYNLSKYIQFEVFQNCLKWVVYIYTLFSPCIAWIGMEDWRLLRFLRILMCKQPCILRAGNESLKPCIVLAVRRSVK